MLWVLMVWDAWRGAPAVFWISNEAVVWGFVPRERPDTLEGAPAVFRISNEAVGSTTFSWMCTATRILFLVILSEYTSQVFFLIYYKWEKLTWMFINIFNNLNSDFLKRCNDNMHNFRNSDVSSIVVHEAIDCDVLSIVRVYDGWETICIVGHSKFRSVVISNSGQQRYPDQISGLKYLHGKLKHACTFFLFLLTCLHNSRCQTAHGLTQSS